MGDEFDKNEFFTFLYFGSAPFEIFNFVTCERRMGGCFISNI